MRVLRERLRSGTSISGAPLRPGPSRRHLGPGRFAGFANRVGDPVALEYPTTGVGDYRIPALVVEPADGSTVLDLRYATHRIVAGKPALPRPARRPTSRPTTRPRRSRSTSPTRRAACASTVRTRSSLTARSSPGALTHPQRRRRDRCRVDRRDERRRSTCRTPTGSSSTLSGAWARERHVMTGRLVPGPAVGRQHSRRLEPRAQPVPRPAPRRDDRGRRRGVSALSLVYSGNFLAEAEVDAVRDDPAPDRHPARHVHLALEPGATFTTPEAVLVWSGDGLGAMSDALHGLYRERLARGTWRDRPRPVLAQQLGGDLLRLRRRPARRRSRRRARDLGVELFVLDDGWFGERDRDDSSLGDWVVDRRKLPDGLDGAGQRTSRRSGCSSGCGSSPRWSASDSDLFARPPGLGDRRPRPAAHREPPAARPRHVAARGRRPPRRTR